MIGLIGLGNFGKLAAKHLVKAGKKIVAFDVSDKSKEAQELGIEFAELDKVLANKTIILSVPMEAMEDTLNKIKDKLQPGAVVIDVCSLKMFSCDLMDKILPDNVEIIGTHPLFGPQSAPDSIAGMRIAIMNVRAKQEIFDKVKDFLEKLEKVWQMRFLAGI